MSVQEKALIVILRLSGIVLLTAFPMMLLPVDWMAATHRWLGLGEFPASTLVDYLTRSISFLYGFHGGLLLLISVDIRRYRGVLVYMIVMSVAFGASMIAVDLHAGIPLRWTLCEGPPISVLSVVLAWLLRAVPRDGKPGY
jgi:hypothetical protein